MASAYLVPFAGSILPPPPSEWVLTMQHIVIVGGGFAGVWSALGASAARRELGRAGAATRITLVTREPYLTIRPRLYEANPASLRVPIDDLLQSRGVELVVGDVTRIAASARMVAVRAGGATRTVPYDRLILAAGSRLRRPAVPGADHAFSVDTYHDAVALDRHLSELTDDGVEGRRNGRFTAVVVGAGLTGLEVGTAMMSRLRRLTTRARSPRQAPSVFLVERAELVAPDLGANPRPLVQTALQTLGVEVRTGAAVVELTRDRVTLSTGEQIDAATTVWTAGLCATDLTLQLPGERDELGRLVVDDCLRVRGVDGVFAAGDAARTMADPEHVAPMSCQFAIPMGDRAGRNAMADLTGREPTAFRPPPYVTCVDLGEWGGLFTQGWDRQVHLAGFWGTKMKETINTRMIYPPGAAGGTVTSPRAARPAA